MSYLEFEHRLLEIMARPHGAPISETEFNTLAVEIYRFQRRCNGPYAEFCTFSGAPEGLSNWRDIPAVPTNAFRLAPLRTFSEAETVVTFQTSGTTGEGYGRHHFATLKLYEHSILSAWRHLSLPALPQVILTPRAENAPHSSLSYMMRTLAEAGYVSEASSARTSPLIPQGWCIDANGRLDLANFRKATENGPVAVLGTALAFLHLFEQLENSPVLLAEGSYAMETGGYKGTGRTLTKEALYAQFQTTLGLHPDAVLNEYSMTELSSQWYTRGLNRPHFGPPWTCALVIDPETGREVPDGETGTVRLFDLANLGSVIAIQTQDLATRRGTCFQLIGRDPAAIPRGCSRTADELLNRP